MPDETVNVRVSKPVHAKLKESARKIGPSFLAYTDKVIIAGMKAAKTPKPKKKP